MPAKNNLLEKIGQRSDLLTGIAVVVILVVLLLPMPKQLIDVLLAINMALAFIILLAPIYIQQPSEFSVFPGILLVITLFRLSINVSTTRAILSRGDAGAIVEAFGSILIGSGDGGNGVFVGIVIFIILFIVNFMVITKGATRIAEVAARFTLDAMPGKQMAIDADLNNGVIDEAEARERRDNIRRDADFYGSMDGASKFVKGDAIAGLIITFINIVGGFVVGMTGTGGLAWDEVLVKYTRLTVGDGLVSQIPALLISTASGIIVTRSGTKENLGKELIQQLFNQPKVLYVAGSVVFLLGFIIPGRWYLFMSMGALLAAFGYWVQDSDKKTTQAEAQRKAEEEVMEQATQQQPEDVNTYLQVDSLELEIGYSLISLIDEKQSGDLLDRISSLRKQIAMEVGILVPPIRIRDNITLVPNQYSIKIRGEEVAGGECLVNHLMALNPGTVEQPIKGIATKEPAFGLPALWISEDKREIAEMHGYTVIEPAAVIATHLSEVVKNSADRIITRQDVLKLMENVKKDNEAVVTELLDKSVLNLGQIEQVIKNLLHEQVPIRDMITILETLADYAPITRDIETLTEYVRYALARTIGRRYTGSDGVVYGISFDAGLERQISDVVNQIRAKNYNASLPPNIVNTLYTDLREASSQMQKDGLQPLVIVSPAIRSYVKRLIEPSLPHLPVVSYNEIPTDIPINAHISIGS